MTELNDEERSLWIDNDEGVYRWWKRSRLSKRQFIKDNRGEIDEAILPILRGEKPAHHLEYGG